jgi:hypothetical protein
MPTPLSMASGYQAIQLRHLIPIYNMYGSVALFRE